MGVHLNFPSILSCWSLFFEARSSSINNPRIKSLQPLSCGAQKKRACKVIINSFTYVLVFRAFHSMFYKSFLQGLNQTSCSFSDRWWLPGSLHQTKFGTRIKKNSSCRVKVPPSSLSIALKQNVAASFVFSNSDGCWGCFWAFNAVERPTWGYKTCSAIFFILHLLHLFKNAGLYIQLRLANLLSHFHSDPTRHIPSFNFVLLSLIFGDILLFH